MARTALQLVKAFSAKRVALDLGKGVEVACVVEDVTLNYGRELLLLRPVVGSGSKWTDARKCRVVPADWGN
jgi:hypothetical protein